MTLVPMVIAFTLEQRSYIWLSLFPNGLSVVSPGFFLKKNLKPQIKSYERYPIAGFAAFLPGYLTISLLPLTLFTLAIATIFVSCGEIILILGYQFLLTQLFSKKDRVMTFGISIIFVAPGEGVGRYLAVWAGASNIQTDPGTYKFITHTLILYIFVVILFVFFTQRKCNND